MIKNLQRYEIAAIFAYSKKEVIYVKNIVRLALMQILVERCVPAYPRISSPSSMLTPKATSPRVVYWRSWDWDGPEAIQKWNIINIGARQRRRTLERVVKCAIASERRSKDLRNEENREEKRKREEGESRKKTHNRDRVKGSLWIYRGGGRSRVFGMTK